MVLSLSQFMEVASPEVVTLFAGFSGFLRIGIHFLEMLDERSRLSGEPRWKQARSI